MSDFMKQTKPEFIHIFSTHSDTYHNFINVVIEKTSTIQKSARKC